MVLFQIFLDVREQRLEYNVWRSINTIRGVSGRILFFKL